MNNWLSQPSEIPAYSRRFSTSVIDTTGRNADQCVHSHIHVSRATVTMLRNTRYQLMLWQGTPIYSAISGHSGWNGLTTINLLQYVNSFSCYATAIVVGLTANSCVRSDRIGKLLSNNRSRVRQKRASVSSQRPINFSATTPGIRSISYQRLHLHLRCILLQHYPEPG